MKLLDYLIQDRYISSDLDEAIYWSKRLDLSPDILPFAIKQALGLLPQEHEEEEDDWDVDCEISNQIVTPTCPKTEIDSHTAMASLSLEDDFKDIGGQGLEEQKFFKLPDHVKANIVFVDNQQMFQDFLASIENEVICLSSPYLIHTGCIFDPRARPITVAAGSDHYFHTGCSCVHPFVRSSQNFKIKRTSLPGCGWLNGSFHRG